MLGQQLSEFEKDLLVLLAKNLPGTLPIHELWEFVESVEKQRIDISNNVKPKELNVKVDAMMKLKNDEQ